VDGLKLWYSVEVRNSNGLGISVDWYFREQVVEVRRVNGMIMSV